MIDRFGENWLLQLNVCTGSVLNELIVEGNCCKCNYFVSLHFYVILIYNREKIFNRIKMHF